MNRTRLPPETNKHKKQQKRGRNTNYLNAPRLQCAQNCIWWNYTSYWNTRANGSVSVNYCINVGGKKQNEAIK